MSLAAGLSPPSSPKKTSCSVAVIPLHVEPIRTKPAYYRIGGHVITSIARNWRDGDSGPDGRCRLCDECTAEDGLCNIIVKAREPIPRELCHLFSTVGLKRHRPLRGELTLLYVQGDGG